MEHATVDPVTCTEVRRQRIASCVCSSLTALHESSLCRTKFGGTEPCSPPEIIAWRRVAASGPAAQLEIVDGQMGNPLFS